MKTHTFNNGKYKIDWCAVEACCDVPSKDGEQLTMLTPPVTDYHTFCIAMHEAEHADGLPDRLIHDKDGCPNHGGRHRFAWRVFKGMIESQGTSIRKRQKNQ